MEAIFQEQPGGSSSSCGNDEDQVSALLIIEDPPRGRWGSVKDFGESFQAAKRVMDDAIWMKPIDFWGPRSGELLQLSTDSELDL